MARSRYSSGSFRNRRGRTGGRKAATRTRSVGSGRFAAARARFGARDRTIRLVVQTAPAPAVAGPQAFMTPVAGPKKAVF